jgi:hypothetical protein
VGADRGRLDSLARPHRRGLRPLHQGLKPNQQDDPRCRSTTPARVAGRRPGLLGLARTGRSRELHSAVHDLR